MDYSGINLFRLVSPKKTIPLKINSAFISLSTIGFGDLVPMVKPPDQYATFTKNDSECFNIMVDPVPSAKISEETGLYEACQEVGYGVFPLGPTQSCKNVQV